LSFLSLSSQVSIHSKTRFVAVTVNIVSNPDDFDNPVINPYQLIATSSGISQGSNNPCGDLFGDLFR